MRLLDVKGLTISGGMSRPGGQGREKLLSRYLPLIASSTSLSIKWTISQENRVLDGLPVATVSQSSPLNLVKMIKHEWIMT